MGKRGISAIVATVLMILITVAGVTIIWVAIIPIISDAIVFDALEGRVSVVSSEGWTVYDAAREVAIVQIKRDVDEGVMNRVRISFSVDGNSVSSSVVAPGSGQMKVYAFDLFGYGVPESVGVAPIFVSGSGREKEGSVTSKVDLSAGSLSEVDAAVYDLERDYFYEKSCLGILNAGNSIGDEIYWINPDGEWKDLFPVYCDMTTDSGGWVLIARTGNDVCSGDFGWNYAIGSLEDLLGCYSLGVGNIDISFSEVMWGINSNDFEWGDYVYKAPMSNEDVMTYDSSIGPCSTPIPLKGGNTGNTMQRCKGFTYRSDSFYMRDCCGDSNYGLRGTYFQSAYCSVDSGGYMCGEKAMLFVR